ncbi:stage II sporulation protein E [Leptospira ryugenii]|uniref:Stage II sporulation protein E n=1 Tax=Leptospira ryugenii TaxID=1917863 RepID=A0A2P2E218_9LEPT|nr:AAA family ATPase [Leptospira ryugenii]GBF50910.1 stage II sporulation protein E [Leptospira ryugenii]
MISLSGYQIRKRMNAEGSPSQVYLAVSNEENKEVVVKYVGISDPLHAAIVNLRNEFEILTYLHKEGLGIKPFEFRRLPDGHALVMDYLKGLFLPDMVENKDAHIMPLNMFYDVAITLAEDLAELHRHKVMHKDIKPDNVIYFPDRNKAKLIDFGISTRLSKEESGFYAPNQLEGSVQYISPEQTGRMNRSVDYRTDFYSLGILYYELSTGQLPFKGSDLMEIIHSHIAKPPRPPIEVNTNLPASLNAIILRLLEKNAENRYQTAYGLKVDLEKSHKLFKEGKLNETFALGARDFSEEFRIPQKLYGREDELKQLLQTFNRVGLEGTTEVVLIGGYSGVGKSSLVKEVQKPITALRGYFLSGKYDQYNRSEPFSAILQVFSSLVRMILTEPPESIARWKERIISALGSNGKVITDILPDLVHIIGEQKSVAEMGASENANRFYAVFLDFIRVFADREHPLAIFLDDMQWADSASLQLLRTLLDDRTTGSLFIMLAYRDNETDANHPFTILIEDIKKESGSLPNINLKPLNIDHIAELLSDSLYTSRENVRELAELLASKTGGNPFFITELLKQLIRQDLIRFDSTAGEEGQGAWVWELSKIKDAAISDNVVELLLERMRSLPKENQDLLRTASSIGNQFDLYTLSQITHYHYDEIIKLVSGTVREELFIPLGEDYRKLDSLGKEDNEENKQTAMSIRLRFQHDRVQQAGYELLSEKERPELHYAIAKVILSNTSKELLEEKIFDIVGHCNKAIPATNNADDYKKFLELNLIAAKRARSAAAYSPCLDYLKQAESLLHNIHKNEDQIWNSDYQQAYDLYRGLAEAEYLNGNFEASESLIFRILKHVKTPLEKAETYKILIVQYSLKAAYKESVDAGLDALRLLGIDISKENVDEAIGKEVARIKELSEGKATETLIDAPLMDKPEMRVAVTLLTDLMSPCWNSYPNMFPLLVFRTVNLYLEHGMNPVSYGYSCYGIILGSGFGQFKDGDDYATLAYRIAEKFQSKADLTKAANVLANFTSPWVRHVKHSEEVNRQGLEASLESGEFQHGSLGAMNTPVCLFFQGKQLSEFAHDINRLLLFGKKVKSILATETVLAFDLIVNNLRGLTPSAMDFRNASMSEAEYLKTCEEHKGLYSITLYNILKAQALFIYEEPEEALKLLEEANKNIVFLFGLVSNAELNFFISLCLASLYKIRSTSERKEIVQKIKVNQKQMKIWAQYSPENFYHKYLLIEAELARLEYKNWKAAKLYDQAVSEARAGEFVQMEAIISEVAARFWLSKKNDRNVAEYYTDAYKLYEQWGAQRKCLELKERYSDYIIENRQFTAAKNFALTISATTTDMFSGQSLDLQSVVKSSVAISGEIQFESLISKLMSIMMENAGAEKGVLLLRDGEGLFVEAEYSVGKGEMKTLMHSPLEAYQNLPRSIIYFTERTREILVLNAAVRDNRFAMDKYIQENQTKSVFCVPILKQGALSGILYLENNLSEGTFTPDRLQTINLLSSQAAISLDNALLYQSLEEKVKDRTQELAHANEELADKNKHITESITYSLNIQRAMLPATDALSQSFRDYFVLYLPKDIVSGDFFWHTIKDGSVLFAVADCTGHGVPGALMSMIGINSLNAIVNEKGITDPGKILEELNIRVRTVLRQDDMDANSMDGMDICLVRYTGNSLQFAGAKRPLYLFGPEGYREIKGDKASIGGRQKEQFRTYTCHEVSYTPGKTVAYLSTDGYTDQSNTERVRVSTKNFLKIAEENLQQPGETQKDAFLSFLRGHMGTEQQRDDITIAGIMI